MVTTATGTEPAPGPPDPAARADGAPVRLTDPALWSTPGLPQTIDALRALAPVHRTETEDDGPVWSVLTYELSAQVLRDTRRYSSEGGSLLGTGTGRPAGAGRMMALCDPPRHRQLRAPATPFFSPGGVRGAARTIDELAGTLVREALRRGEVDLVDLVSALPLEVMCDLLDVPDGDRPLVVRVCDAAFLGRTPEERRGGHQQLIPYLMHQVMRRRADPGDDLISAMAQYRAGGRLLPVEDVVLNLDNIVVGGVQTVRHTAAMSLLALIRDPALWRHLTDGAAEVGAAVDELLRWTSVGLHTLRTVTEETELGGRRLAPGDRVVPWIWAANRDPGVFERPHEIDFARSPNRHLALGLGAHYCIGAPLAKAELGALFTAVLRHTSRVELTGEPKYNGSIINFGLDACPVRLTPR
ncbi:cytochrome P450 [Streptomyces sp. TRM 70351]|uniref:cytochrome P450 n=1 Tax=Streptomyces sp. TRM 70351 TaxID=3116552 RepID=UPI002E7ADBCB|nr:cytochrome P450 [Streptomyces sp. TRM 70351]MEE1929013.1 cytochrome P450 [Streptomyces sp. TRM 70351]